MKTGTFPPDSELRKIKIIFTDIDDTLTKDGFLISDAFSAIWRLSLAGYSVIPVTGRPAGWCDCIVRQWPVKAVIGENGAFVFYLNEHNHLNQFYHPSVSAGDIHAKLAKMKDDVLIQIPKSRIAKDQPYRKFDLAIDFAEEPPVLGLDVAEKIKKICESHGAVAKISSIHVNAWFGNYNKLDMVKLYSDELLGISEDELKKIAIFCGDSPNDEPMFGYFPLSFGMANVIEFNDLIETKPAFVTTESYGYGFAEVAEKLLSIN